MSRPANRRLSYLSGSRSGSGSGHRRRREEPDAGGGSSASVDAWALQRLQAPAAAAAREELWPGSPHHGGATSETAFDGRGRIAGAGAPHSNTGGGHSHSASRSSGSSMRKADAAIVPLWGPSYNRTFRWSVLTTAAALASAYCATAAAAAPSDSGVGSAVVLSGSSARTAVLATASAANAGPLATSPASRGRMASSGGGGGGRGSSADGNAAGGLPAPAAPFTSVQATKGHRSYMEDEYFLSNDGSFAAVYDGHGGSSVSKYLRQNLYAQVQAHFPIDGPGTCTLEEATEALQKAFKRVDDEVMQVKHWSYQGSTAVVVLLHRDPEGRRHIVTANVGDSRAVLSRRGRAIDLTQDHKPNSESELERVHNLGGTVEWFGFFDPERQPIEGTGVWRINGNLAVARAIGDRSERPFVSGEVEIQTYPVEADGDQFVILATDGLWDVMTSDEAVEYVQEVMGGAVGALREGGADGRMGAPATAAHERPADMKLSDWTQRYADDRHLVRAAMMMRKKKMARYLTEEAIRRGTMDNVTVVVIWLN